MAKVLIEFYMKRARVDPTTVEDAGDKKAIKSALRLIKQEQYAKAIEALRPLEFEWNWDNGDGNPRNIFTSSQNVNFELNKKNSTIKVGERDGSLVITAAAYFELSLKRGVSRKVAQEWMNDNSTFFCGFIGRGWLYSDDDGGGVSVLSPASRSATKGTKSAKVNKSASRKK